MGPHIRRQEVPPQACHLCAAAATIERFLLSAHQFHQLLECLGGGADHDQILRRLEISLGAGPMHFEEKLFALIINAVAGL